MALAQHAIFSDSTQQYVEELQYDRLLTYAQTHLPTAQTNEDSVRLTLAVLESWYGKTQHDKVIHKADSLLTNIEEASILEKDHFRLYELLIRSLLVKRENATAESYYQALLLRFTAPTFDRSKQYLKGRVLLAKRQYKEAIVVLEALPLDTVLTDTPKKRLQQIKAWLIIGDSYKSIQDWGKAIENYRLAQQSADKLPLRIKANIESQINYSLGTVAYFEGNHRLSLEHYEKALHYHTVIDTTKHLEHFIVLSGMGISYNSLADYGKALEYLTASLGKALKIFEPFSLPVAKIYYSIGVSHSFLKEKEVALKYLNQCLVIRDSLAPTNHSLLGFTNSGIGSVYFNNKSYEEALPFLEKAKREFQLNNPEGHYYILMMNNSIAATLGEINRHEESVRLLKNNLKTCSELGLSTHLYCITNTLNVGIEYFKMGRYEESLVETHAGLQQLLPEFTSEDWRDNPIAISYHQSPRVLEAWREKMRCLHKLYETTQDTNYLSAANAVADSLSKSIDKLRANYSNRLSKMNLSSTHKNSYALAMAVKKDLWEATDEQQYLQAAFGYLEQSKSLLLSEQMRRSQGQTNLPTRLQEREKKLNEEVLKLEQKVKNSPDSLSQSMQEEFGATQLLHHLFLDSLKAAYPAYHELIYGAEIPAITTVQEQLSEEEALVAYHIGRYKVFSFVFTKDTVALFQTKRDSIFDNLLDEQIDILANGTKEVSAVFLKNSEALYQRLWQPFAKMLTNKKVHIIRDGKLHFFPFGLLVPTYQGESYYRANWLLRTHPITYQYSTALWLKDKERKQQSKPVTTLSIAPEFRFYGTNLLEQIRQVRSEEGILFGAKEEIETIFAPYQGQQLIGKAANKEQFLQLAPQHDLLHIASHAFTENTNSLASNILFTTDSLATKRGVLYANEIYGLSLPNNQMTVLSACHTMNGRLVEGEGILSLARAFFYAGTRSVITTAWAAPDRQTRLIMQYFYKNLEEGASKDVALQQAKLRYLKNTQDQTTHPTLWSGFVVIGNPAAIQIAKKSNLVFWVAVGFLGLLIFFGGLRYFGK